MGDRLQVQLVDPRDESVDRLVIGQPAAEFARASLIAPQLAADRLGQVRQPYPGFARTKDVAQASCEGSQGWDEQLQPVEDLCLRVVLGQHDQTRRDRGQAYSQTLQQVV